MLTDTANRIRGIGVKMDMTEKETFRSWNQKIIRTVRVRNSHKTGVLGKLLTITAEAGGNIASIVLLTETSRHTVRDLPRTV